MAILTRDDVKHVADLSNLKLTDSEIEKFTPQLAKIVEFVSQLSEIDTNGITPTSQTTGLKNVLREDVVKPSEIVVDQEFKVPAILTNRSNS